MYVQFLNISLFNLNFYNCYKDELLNEFLENIITLILNKEKEEEEEKKYQKEKEENELYENSILNTISNNFLNILIYISKSKNINEEDKLFLENLLGKNKNLKINEYKVNKIDIKFINTFSEETFDMIFKYLQKKYKINIQNKINLINKILKKSQTLFE
jgi:hypothetical protein